MAISQALIFAAGLGERMRPLTNTTPKPLLQVGDQPLIVWHLEQLQRLGVRNVVINTSWLAEQFPALLGDGSQWDMRIQHSVEGTPPLETGGGMFKAFTHIDPTQSLLAVNGDVWTSFNFQDLPSTLGEDLAHLVLVDNPDHNPRGDFALNGDRVQNTANHALTFAGIGLYSLKLFDQWQDIAPATAIGANGFPQFKLAPLLRAAMQSDRISGQHYLGEWTDVGTPARLHSLDAAIRAKG